MNIYDILKSQADELYNQRLEFINQQIKFAQDQYEASKREIEQLKSSAYESARRQQDLLAIIGMRDDPKGQLTREQAIDIALEKYPEIQGLLFNAESMH